METSTIGRVTTEATIENLGDLYNANHGLLPPDQVRRVVMSDALVDTGASLLSLPSRLIRHLGLERVRTRRVTSSAGPVEVGLYESVRLTIQDRFCSTDVLEVPDDVPVLIGQIALESLDLIVDPVQRRVSGNPAHGGELIYEMYCALESYSKPRR
ncbi:MAG: aspartyl protease family protein [Thermoguttaceae bacterium]